MNGAKIKLFSLYLLDTLSDGLQSILLLLLPYLSNDLSINIVQVGTLGSLLHLMGIVFAIPAGIWAAKHGGFKILTVSVLLYGFGFFATAATNSYPILVLAFTVAGVGFAVFPPIRLALLAKLFDSSDRAKRIGEFSAIGDLGRVAVTATVSSLIALLGWRMTSSIYGFICLLSFAFLFWVFFFKLNELKIINNEPYDFKKLFRLSKNKLFVAATAAATIDTLASSQLFVFLPFLLVYKNIDPILLGPFTAVYFLGNIVGKIVAGRFAKKYGSAQIFAVSEIFMCVIIVLIALSVNSDLILALSFILGFSTKWTSPTSQAMVIESAGSDNSIEVYTSSYSLVRTFAKAASPLLLGIIANSLGIVSAFYFSALVAIVAIIPAYRFQQLLKDL